MGRSEHERTPHPPFPRVLSRRCIGELPEFPRKQKKCVFASLFLYKALLALWDGSSEGHHTRSLRWSVGLGYVERIKICTHSHGLPPKHKRMLEQEGLDIRVCGCFVRRHVPPYMPNKAHSPAPCGGLTCVVCVLHFNFQSIN